jgi:hypothetical protein
LSEESTEKEGEEDIIIRSQGFLSRYMFHVCQWSLMRVSERRSMYRET